MRAGQGCKEVERNPFKWSALDSGNLATIANVATNEETEYIMAWKTPKIVEIALGAEINSYACADLKK